MLTKIIYKNFRSNFKNYVAFFIGNMIGVTEFFVFWGLYSIVKNMSANSVMLEDTLEEIIISVSVITIFSNCCNNGIEFFMFQLDGFSCIGHFWT